MIKKLLNSLLGGKRRSASSVGVRREIQVAEHGIDASAVDSKARQVVETLQQAGYEAYIVGGAVRDLLLGLRPKDFDVATNATPEQVKGLFRRAFIIGKRFRIVHVVFGRGREHEVIEVSTFRAQVNASNAQAVKGNEHSSRAALAGMKHAVDASGRVLRDNVWGDQDEDAARRDFTVNALYYDPTSEIVVDYHQGLRDAGKRVIRMIGDPATRYREDPVRIIRAVRFAAKLSALGFKLDKTTAAPLVDMRHLLGDVPPSRMFDEMIKLLQTGHATASIAQLRLLGLAEGIDPLLDLVVERGDEPLLRAALEDTDRRVGEGKPVAPSFLLAALLWRDVHADWQQRLKQGEHAIPALHGAMDAVFDARIGDVSGRGRLAADMREIWAMQPRFERRQPRTVESLIAHARFRAGFDFLRLRSEVGEVDLELADWWQEYSLASDAERQDLLEQARSQAQRSGSGGSANGAAGNGSRPKRRRRKPRSASGSNSAGAAD